MIKGLIFDLDNTLIDRQRAFSEMLLKVLHERFEDEKLIQEMLADILKFDNNGRVERKDAFKMWTDKYNITSIDPIELANNWSKISGSVTYLYDDVRPTLTKLKEKYKLAVLSNGNASSQRRKMQSIAIDDLLDYSLISSEFGVRKPDPSIFLYTCDQLQLKPKECVYIGDTYDLDVLGPKKAGLDAIYVSRFNEVHDDVTTIFQIADLLKIF